MGTGCLIHCPDEPMTVLSPEREICRGLSPAVPLHTEVESPSVEVTTPLMRHDERERGMSFTEVCQTYNGSISRDPEDPEHFGFCLTEPDVNDECRMPGAAGQKTQEGKCAVNMLKQAIARRFNSQSKLMCPSNLLEVICSMDMV